MRIVSNPSLLDRFKFHDTQQQLDIRIRHFRYLLHHLTPGDPSYFLFTLYVFFDQSMFSYFKNLVHFCTSYSNISLSTILAIQPTITNFDPLSLGSHPQPSHFFVILPLRENLRHSPSFFNTSHGLRSIQQSFLLTNVNGPDLRHAPKITALPLPSKQLQLTISPSPPIPIHDPLTSRLPTKPKILSLYTRHNHPLRSIYSITPSLHTFWSLPPINKRLTKFHSQPPVN